VFEREFQDDRILSIEEENNIFQSMYKNIIGCKSSKLHGHGYLAKYPTRRQLMEAQIEEHARALAAAHQKIIQLESKVQQLEEQLVNEAIARDTILEENRRQIQEDEQKAKEVLREKLREDLKKEMLSIITHQREEILQPQPQVIFLLGVQ
jgi:signal recognition particle GTPase